MTDAELSVLEHFAKSQDDTITVELIAELRQVEAERDWLLKKITGGNQCPEPFSKGYCCASDCLLCWEEAAKEATCTRKD